MNIDPHLVAGTISRVNLTRLSAAEREALLLLAEGHTAKSIATTVGCSTGAVNERLREARRKTGVGSSRELARLLRAAENRDENIGVAPAVDPAATEETEAPHAWSGGTRWKGWMIMVGALTMGVAALLVFAAPEQGAAPSETAVQDPLLGNIMKEEHWDPRRLYETTRSEGRDPAWASATESVLRNRYGSIPHIGTAAAPLRITCGRTICEVTGLIDAPQPAPAKPSKGMERAMEELQGKALNDDLTKAGLKSKGIMFTAAANAPDRSMFLAYWTRAGS
jgi:DNA-binding CsgD family transcriptional regulator